MKTIQDYENRFKGKKFTYRHFVDGKMDEDKTFTVTRVKAIEDINNFWLCHGKYELELDPFYRDLLMEDGFAAAAYFDGYEIEYYHLH